MRFLLLVLLSGALFFGGCASTHRTTYRADLIPGYDPDTASDWSVIDIGPELLSAKRWGEPVNDMADFW